MPSCRIPGRRKKSSSRTFRIWPAQGRRKGSTKSAKRATRRSAMASTGAGSTLVASTRLVRHIRCIDAEKR